MTVLQQKEGSGLPLSFPPVEWDQVPHSGCCPEPSQEGSGFLWGLKQDVAGYCGIRLMFCDTDWLKSDMFSSVRQGVARWGCVFYQWIRIDFLYFITSLYDDSSSEGYILKGVDEILR